VLGRRYDRSKAPRGFVAWWKVFTSNKKLQTERIHVIYGHTHVIDIVEKRELEKMVNKTIDKPELILVNHPAWVKDNKDRHKDELQEAFIYVDKHGYEFFGWNWDSNVPFHIPKSVIRTYISGKPIGNSTVDLLNGLHWQKN
jgi:hypothetical protein